MVCSYSDELLGLFRDCVLPKMMPQRCPELTTITVPLKCHVCATPCVISWAPEDKAPMESSKRFECDILYSKTTMTTARGNNSRFEGEPKMQNSNWGHRSERQISNNSWTMSSYRRLTWIHVKWREYGQTLLTGSHFYLLCCRQDPEPSFTQRSARSTSTKEHYGHYCSWCKMSWSGKRRRLGSSDRNGDRGGVLKNG